MKHWTQSKVTQAALAVIVEGIIECAARGELDRAAVWRVIIAGLLAGCRVIGSDVRLRAPKAPQEPRT